MPRKKSNLNNASTRHARCQRVKRAQKLAEQIETGNTAQRIKKAVNFKVEPADEFEGDLEFNPAPHIKLELSDEYEPDVEVDPNLHIKVEDDDIWADENKVEISKNTIPCDKSDIIYNPYVLLTRLVSHPNGKYYITYFNTNGQREMIRLWRIDV